MLGPASAIFSLLLIATGTAKLRHPDDTSRALAAIGIPVHKGIGLGVGAIELGTGVAVITTHSVSALLAQTLLFTAFALWISFAMIKNLPITSCGCLGTPDTPPYWGHLVVDLTSVFVSFGAAISGAPGFDSSGIPAVGTLFLVSIAAFLCWVVIGDGARLYGATKT